MTTISKEAAADMLGTNIDEINLMCKREQLEIIDDGYLNIPQISMRSAVEMTGNVYKEDEPVAHWITFDEAAMEIGIAASSVKTYANQGKLRKDGYRVDAYSVDAYIESKTPKNGEEPLVDFTDFTGMDEPSTQNEEIELSDDEDVVKCGEAENFTQETLELSHNDNDELKAKEHQAWKARENELKAAKIAAENEDLVTLSKKDFNAALSIASMRSELQVYRSMKSFERR